MDQKEKRKHTLGDATLLIAIATAAGYLSACAYQYFYLNYFGVSSIFLEVNIIRILLIVLVCAALSGSVIFCIILLASAASGGPWSCLKKFISYSVFVALIAGVIFAIISIIYNPLYPLLTSVSSVICFVFAVSIGFKTYFDIKKGEKYKDDSFDRFFDLLQEAFGTSLTILAYLSVLLILFGLTSGIIFAKNQANFLVSEAYPGFAVISSYGNNLLAVGFDPANNKLDHRIMILSQDQVTKDGVIFSNKKIGPLKQTD